MVITFCNEDRVKGEGEVKKRQSLAGIGWNAERNGWMPRHGYCRFATSGKRALSSRESTQRTFTHQSHLSPLCRCASSSSCLSRRPVCFSAPLRLAASLCATPRPHLKQPTLPPTLPPRPQLRPRRVSQKFRRQPSLASQRLLELLRAP